MGNKLISPVLHGLALHARILLDIRGRGQASSVVILGSEVVNPQVRGAQLSAKVCEILRKYVWY